MEYRREIAVVYTLEDALKKIEKMFQHGFSEKEIHIFAKDTSPIKSIKTYTKLNIHQSGNLFDKLQSFLYNMALYEVCLRQLRFSEEEMHHYGHLIEKGAIFMVAQHHEPYEKEPSKRYALQRNTP